MLNTKPSEDVWGTNGSSKYLNLTVNGQISEMKDCKCVSKNVIEKLPK